MEQLILEKFSSQEIIDYGIQQCLNTMNGAWTLGIIAAIIVGIGIAVIAVCAISDNFCWWFWNNAPNIIPTCYIILFALALVSTVFFGVMYAIVSSDYNKILNSPEPIAVTTALEYWES